jgi:hypothetical protein
MNHSSYHRLIDRGRKAGLSTRELYSALATRSPEGTDPGLGRADGNGYVAEFDAAGQRTYRPIGEESQGR